MSEDGYNCSTPQLHLFRPTIYQLVMQVKLKLHANTLELLSVVIHRLSLLPSGHMRCARCCTSPAILLPAEGSSQHWTGLTGSDSPSCLSPWDPQDVRTVWWRYGPCNITQGARHWSLLVLKQLKFLTAACNCVRREWFSVKFLTVCLQKQLHTAHLLNSSLSVEDIQELSFTTI